MEHGRNFRIAFSYSLLKGKRTAVILLLSIVIALPFQANAIRFGTIDMTHTYVGALVMKDFVPPLISPVVCTGSLVSPKVFLLAAHCLRNIEVFLGGFSTSRYFVSFATNVIEDTGSWKTIARVVTHPGFHARLSGLGTYTNDYTAIILAQPVADITPGTIAPIGYLDSLVAEIGGRGTRFLAVGYGVDENFQIDGSRKSTSSEFQALTQSWLFVSTNTHTENSGPCIHDSGSPALHLSGSTEYIVGTLSGFPNFGPSLCNVLMGYDRVDIATAQDFIFGVIAANQ